MCKERKYLRHWGAAPRWVHRPHSLHYFINLQLQNANIQITTDESSMASTAASWLAIAAIGPSAAHQSFKSITGRTARAGGVPDPRPLAARAFRSRSRWRPGSAPAPATWAAAPTTTPARPLRPPPARPHDAPVTADSLRRTHHPRARGPDRAVRVQPLCQLRAGPAAASQDPRPRPMPDRQPSPPPQPVTT